MRSETVYCPQCDCHVTPARDGSGKLYCPLCEELVPPQAWYDEEEPLPRGAPFVLRDFAPLELTNATHR